MAEILHEVRRAGLPEANAYLVGAMHDGTFNPLHKTVRIAQADTRWLHVLQLLFRTLGHRSWIYREGTRNVWVVESICRLQQGTFIIAKEQTAFVRGYFDAEGGVPMASNARFYVQFVQKNLEDLARVRDAMAAMGMRCGTIHNPSERVDPDYWRFYVLASSHHDFIVRINSWHPRKRFALSARASLNPTACGLITAH